MKNFTFLVFFISLFFSLLFVQQTNAQIDFGSPVAPAMGGSITATAKDWSAIEINPSNLGWKGNHGFSLSILNVGINIQDNALTASKIKQVSNGIVKNGLQDSATSQILQQAVTAPGGFNLNTTVTWAAMSFNIPKIGGFAINLSDEIYAHAYTNPTAASLLFEGSNSPIYKSTLNRIDSAKNTKYANLQDSIQAWENFYSSISNLFNGTSIGGYHYRELNIDYGRKLFSIKTHPSPKNTGASYQNSDYLTTNGKKADTIKSDPIEIYGGIGFKPVWGFADYNILVTGDQLNANGTYVNNYPKELTSLSNFSSANGRGYGVDLGLSAVYKKWKLGISAIDLGSITWHNNSYTSATVNTPNVNQITSNLKDSNQSINNLVQIFVSQGVGPDYTTALPSKFRSGLSFQVTKGIVLASDFVAPLNTVPGNLLNPYLSVGATVNCFDFFNLGFGYGTEKGFGNVVPVGIFVNFISGFDFYVATDDITAYLSNSTGHYLSASFGFRIFGF